MVSCHQDIAGSGAFSLGMIAQFKAPITDEPFRYRHLFWESGMIGQVLYLAAEAHGARGTGIGCFFDDAVHEILGLKDNQYQSLYHFTIGRPVEDPRLTTYPPYHHLKNR
jgi:nitroreductase